MKNNYSSICRILSIGILISLLLISNVVTASTKWELKKDADDIQVYLRNTPGSPVKSFKAHVKIKSSLAGLITIIRDTETYPRWLHNCRFAKLLQEPSERQTINYVVTNMPWPVADRDVVLLSELTQNLSTKQVTIKFHAKSNFAAKVAGKVRIDKMQGHWLLTPINNNEVEVTYEMFVDPGGGVPKWLVNSLAVDLPFYSLRNLKKLSQEAQYANAKIKSIIEISQ